MSRQVAKPIRLNSWQNPQGDVVLHHSRDTCIVSFGCWDAQGQPADYICQLKFHHAWAVHAVNSEFLPYELADTQRSCIYEVEDSAWLKRESEQRVQNYPQWREWDQQSYHHYVVSGHDNYCEVIAASFEECIVPREKAGELVKLID